MLPERLSNGICSLNPRADRLTMSAIMELDAKGRVVDYTLAPSVIHSRERMTYTAVSEIINNPEGETAQAVCSHQRDAAGDARTHAPFNQAKRRARRD